MSAKFPMPFGGIEYRIQVPYPALPDVLKHLSRGCGHGHSHNFAVEIDATNPNIYGSTLLINCVMEALRENV